LNLVLIRSPQRFDVTAPEVTGSDNVCTPPCERLLAQSAHDYICHKPGMTTIAVSERVNPNEHMVQPDSEFVRLEGMMLYPITRIA
jgi:hypothetical protein